MRDFRTELANVATNSVVTGEDLDDLEKKLAALQKFAESTSFASRPLFQIDISSLQAGLDKVREIRSLQQQAPGTGADSARLQEIQTFMQQQSAAPFEAMSSALSGAVGTSAQVAANLERAAAAARQAAAAQGGGGGGEGEGLWNGGKPRYFADGGPVGTDRIPAYLSRGETVMNAPATSRFYAQLSSMNAGHRPAAATTVGDTNVTFNGGINVTGGTTNAKTGDAIVTEVRRSLRRGSSRPF
jgi:hypothetical protein